MIVVGVDFGTQSVRTTLLNIGTRKVISSASKSYIVKRSEADPLSATQSHDDQMAAFQVALADAIKRAGVQGADIVGLGCATTGSSVIVTDENLVPITDYYLWCDHRAYQEAELITQTARDVNLEAIQWCGNTYSHEWGYAKLLHFLRHNPALRSRAALALENCDMFAATLCGVQNGDDLVRSVCAMGHKWMWGKKWGGYPSDEFLGSVDPLLSNASSFLRGEVKEQGDIAGKLSKKWAELLGLNEGIPIAVGAFDAHWDAVGAGAIPGDMVNIIGTSTCMIGILDVEPKPVSGICGIVPGSVVSNQIGIEAGLSAVGDVFQAIAKRCNRPLQELTDNLSASKRKMTGLIRIPWDNGDRTILVDANLGGVLVGLDLEHSAEDELQGAIEGTAFHTKLILDHISAELKPFNRIINGGGIPSKNPLLNQIYADILGIEIHVPVSSTTGIGPAVFAAVGAGCFSTVTQAQEAFCPQMQIFTPNPAFADEYAQTYELFKELYHSLGQPNRSQLNGVLKTLRKQRLAVTP